MARIRQQSARDSYAGVILVLEACSFLGSALLIVFGSRTADPALLDAGLSLGVALVVLLGITAARARAGEAESKGRGSLGRAGEQSTAAPGGEGPGEPSRLPSSDSRGLPSSASSTRLERWMTSWPGKVAGASTFFRAAGVVGGVGALVLAPEVFTRGRPIGVGGLAGPLICLVGVVFAATAARYLASADGSRFPEALGLARGARLSAWVLVLTLVATGLAWGGNPGAARIVHGAILLAVAGVSYGFLRVRLPGEKRAVTVGALALDLPVLKALASRANVLASLLDSAEQQLGVDLRSTWALTVVRRSIEPLVIALCLLGWLSTSLTIVHIGQVGLVERFGVPLAGRPLQPGMHVHWPLPIDHVFLLPVREVRAIHIGHGGEEQAGPENVLWARKHAAHERLLLLGNGRDLLAIDAAVWFRIRDARAWFYDCENPMEALRAIAYRAVMRSTVSLTLDQALSQNTVILTRRMREMVQREADGLGLGVQIVAFTVSGLHPPVEVAPDYQAVAAAKIGMATSIVNAEAFRNETVPAAQADVVKTLDGARATSAGELALANGEAWSFRTLELQYRIAPSEYLFRRRLEGLEKSLAGHRFVIVDSRIQRDGGELWLTQ